ncbi:MAG: hypothetical protein MAGBODY4_01255 [Candidatus Marinimicrobia bacterium]|nr:hypothetical protein [Candidatus Neomarinimicrobiota bacterium]
MMPRLKQSLNNKGFTFIEVMVTVLIISIAAIGMMQGIAYARGMLRSVKIENQALDALNRYMEEYRGVIAAFGGNMSSYIAQPRTPREVVLLEDPNNTGNNVYGYIYRETVEDIQPYNMNNQAFYHLKTWIEWDEYPNDQITQRRKLEAEVSYIQY